jgi:hypothetical protein
MIYGVFDTDEFYAVAYNNTINYLYEVEAVWQSDATSVGTVTTPGLWTNFTAQQVASDSICTVTAIYGTFSNSTGLLTVLAPRIDYIQIEDAAGGGFPGVGTVDPAGHMTNFTAQQVATDSTCTITATYGTFGDTTGLLTVLYPRVDYIQIEDAAGGTGNIVDTATYEVMDTDEFYAVAYNNTINYLYEASQALVRSIPLVT